MASDENGADREALGRQIAVYRGAINGIADAMSMIGLPSTILQAAAEKAVTKRRDAARQILLEELGKDEVDFEPEVIAQVDESASIMVRYLRATDEGTRTRNLRLLARAFRRQLREGRADAESFQQTADSIGDLSNAELALLGGWFAFGAKASLADYRDSLGITHQDGAEMHGTAAALLRNGLVLPSSAWDSMAFNLAPSALRLLQDLRPDDFVET